MMALLVLYVDDIILASNNPEKLQEIKIKFCKAFHMKDLGEPRIYLGMKIERDRKIKILTLRGCWSRTFYRHQTSNMAAR